MPMKAELIDYMGDDNSVVNAARVSFAKEASNFTDGQNHRLIRYLARHKHEIPFAHTAITLRMKAPISIRTQCFKHKIGFVENEISRRYVSETPELFVPEFREAPKGNVKQGSGDVIEKVEPYLKHEQEGKEFRIYRRSHTQESIKSMYTNVCNRALVIYEEMIKPVNKGGLGIAPEQARFILPQGVMTEWIWTGSLLAFARFYNLRTDPRAQKEIQILAKMVGDIIEPLYPVSWHALTNKEDTENE